MSFQPVLCRKGGITTLPFPFMSEDDLWGKVNMQDWRNTPCISSSVAVEEDFESGRAVFYLQNAEEIGAQPIDVELPRCAILREEESCEELPVIIIQAEEAEGCSYVGYRFLTGGNGICTIAEVEFLSEPDERFFNIE